MIAAISIAGDLHRAGEQYLLLAILAQFCGSTQGSRSRDSQAHALHVELFVVH